MKKTFNLIVLLLCIVSISANAQRNVQIAKFRFGIQASPTLSNLRSTDLGVKTNGIGNLGIKTGVIAEYYFRENYAICSGIGFGFNQGGQLLHDKGGNYFPKSTLTNPALNAGTKSKSLPDGVKLRYHLNHLEIPISLKMRTGQFGYLRYFAEAPIITLGILTKARGDISGDKVTAERENIKSDVVPLAMSWGFGAGVQYDVSDSFAFTGGIYYQRIFTDVTRNSGYKATTLESEGDPLTTSDDTYTTVKEDSRVTNGIFVLRIGVLF